MKTVSCFSAGVSSAVATKILIKEIDEIIYTHVDDQHIDTMRFVLDCEKWFDKKITILQSPYKNVFNVCTSQRYINGVAGAPCSKFLKVYPRLEWEDNQVEKIRYVWGFDSGKKEENRLKKTISHNTHATHVAPLIDKSITKEIAHQIFGRSGIKRPKMYSLGYHNNNCIGCVKASGAGYWNKIRVDFPSVFAARAKLERDIGASCINGTYLDSLDMLKGNKLDIITEECGMLCQIEMES